MSDREKNITIHNQFAHGPVDIKFNGIHLNQRDGEDIVLCPYSGVAVKVKTLGLYDNLFGDQGAKGLADVLKDKLDVYGCDDGCCDV